MNKISVGVIAGCLLLLLLVTNAFSQTALSTNKVNRKGLAKLDKSKVPKLVTEAYLKEHPINMNESWYGYPHFDIRTHWYDYYPYLYTIKHPENYVAEYTNDNTPYEVLYYSNGDKIATHKKLNSDLPKAVSDALNKSVYKDWKIGDDKEEIFKDSESDQLKVYKVDVEKGGKNILSSSNLTANY